LSLFRRKGANPRAISRAEPVEPRHFGTLFPVEQIRPLTSDHSISDTQKYGPPFNGPNINPVIPHLWDGLRLAVEFIQTNNR
jgi:hypothetical protein